MSVVALHEAAHATIAHILGVRVKRAVAIGPDPHVRTLTPRRGDRDELANWKRCLAVIDFAGAAVETEANDAVETDRRNAFCRCRQAIALEDGVGVEELDGIQLADASALYQHLEFASGRARPRALSVDCPGRVQVG